MSGEGPLVVKVDVEYCGAWGYGSRYDELRYEILNAYPSALVSGKVGRSSSFEVVLNGTLIFSKLECQGFPFAKDVIAEIKKLEGGHQVEKIDNSQAPGCAILWSGSGAEVCFLSLNSNWISFIAIMKTNSSTDDSAELRRMR